MSVAINSAVSCNHHCHLFDDPLCSKLSIVRKIINIAFHILTLGIPFVIYRIIACCFKDKINKAIPGTIEVGIDLEGIRSGRIAMPEISDLGRMVIEEVEQELFSLEDIQWKLPKYLPINAHFDIVYMLTSFEYRCYLNLSETLKKYKNVSNPNPNLHSELLDIAEKCVKVGYVLGIKLLEYVLSTKKFLSLNHQEVSCLDVFVDKRFTNIRFLYQSTTGYHTIRSFVEDDSENNIVSEFYQEGSKMNSCRLLYNELCNRIRYYLSEEDINGLIIINGYRLSNFDLDHFPNYSIPYGI